MDNLTALVQALPSKILKQILNLTFTPDHTEAVVVKCDKIKGTYSSRMLAPSLPERFTRDDYQPPRLLPCSHATREHFAQAYYGNGPVFYIVADCVEPFFDSLPLKRACLVRDIRIMETQDFSTQSVARQKRIMEHFFDIYESLWEDVIRMLICHMTSCAWALF